MSKTKMRCNTCGKWFQSANARDLTCPDCTQKARKAKLASKNAPPTINKAPVANQPTVAAKPAAPPKPKSSNSGTNQWLDNLADVKIGEPEPPPQKPKIITPPVHKESGPGGYRGSTGNNTATGSKAPQAPSNGGPKPQRPPFNKEGSARAPQKPWQKPGGAFKGKGKPKAAKPPLPPKPKKEKIPPPTPFVPTEEQIKQVEERYVALCQPEEFDGIRTQIAKELGIPKRAVKKIVKDLRDRQHIPSWWELQTYKGSNEDLEKIKLAYQPHLPIPAVGVHKQIAVDLDMKPGDVYQAIKTIRLELNLPQYNDPSIHKDELKQAAQSSASE